MVSVIPALVLGLVMDAFTASGDPPDFLLAAPATLQQVDRAAAQLPVPSAPLKQVAVNGARFFTESRIAEFLRLHLGAPLPEPAATLAEELRERYAGHGYSFARVEARFDQAAGRLTFDIDEGRIDAVEFVGVPGHLATAFTEDFALQPGDIFRDPEARRALRLLLRPTQGAVQPDESGAAGSGGSDRPIRMPFEMIDRDGKRILIVHLSAPRSDFNLSLGTEGREDWFSPVDGFSPAVGFNETIFDPGRFNHTYITGYASYKFGRERGGYSLGFERPFLAGQRLFLGAEVHDQTASDDFWRLSVLEQSLATAGFKSTSRDYYGRRGYQLNASVRFGAGHEILGAWRDERQEPLANTTDFSVFRGDRTYRPNLLAEQGRLHAVVVGYIWDSRGLEDEPRSRRYERHQMVDLFGSWAGGGPGWRVEATGEVAAPEVLGGDFDYRRYVFHLRRYNRLSPDHALNLRAVVGIGQGQLPPQRLFAVGGVGSVPGYDFKQAAGERMVLVGAEYEYRLSRGVHPLVIYDAGRVLKPVPPSTGAWLHSLGTGLELGDSFRLEVFWPLTGGRSAQFLVRLRPAF